MSSAYPVRFRLPGAVTVAAVIAAIGTLPLAAASWALTPLLLVPLGIAAWSLRSGTEAGPEGLRVRALLGTRRIPWTEVAEITADGRGRGYARLQDGRAVPLTGVRAADLPRLVDAAQ